MLRLIVWTAAIWFVLVFFTGCSQQNDGNLKASHKVSDQRVIKGDDAKVVDAADAKTPPINVTTYYTVGLLLENQGNFAGAIEKFTQTLKLDPHHINASNHLGLCYLKLRNFEPAQIAFGQAIRQSPNQAYLHNNLGFAYLMDNKFPNAQAELKHALSLDPNFTRAHQNLAVTLAKQGKTDDALKHFLKSGSESEANYNLALILHSQSKFDQAEKYYKLALKSNSEFQPARKGLDQLKSERSSKIIKMSESNSLGH